MFIKLFFWDLFIIDKKLGSIEALKHSWHLTEGVEFNLFIFLAILIGINLLGAWPLGVGLFFTIPTTLVALAFVYRSLLAQTEVAQGESVETIQEDNII